MVEWTSPAEILKDTDVFSNLIFTFFGIYLWEIFQTCGFEWSLLTRKRKFTWPLVLFFFLCRYCMLFALVGLILSIQISRPINCNALYTFNSWTGNMAILAASTSLMIRTFALWEMKRKIVIPICFLCLAHWAILWRGMFIVHAEWSSSVKSCVVVQSDHIFLNFTFFMTMGFDFIILCCTVAALYSKHKSRSDLWNLLFRDGLVYFFITFFCNALPAIFNVLNLNGHLTDICILLHEQVPAATIASIAACRLVIRLQEFNKDVYVHSGSGNNALPPNAGRFGTITTPRGYPMPRRPEVHVTTDHYVMQDFRQVLESYCITRVFSLTVILCLDSPISPTGPPLSPSMEKNLKNIDMDSEKDYEADSEVHVKRPGSVLTAEV
ncbi:hypothetical protein K474DRAFT_1589454 [Panus rudis PR-1116 ss-1]|nr:hypothetical protein K474DRAFT_1589454 [Panus rudis PR-1116 ss-1]